MKIEKDRVVSFHYDLHEIDNHLLESSRDSQPVLYLHGYPGILAAVAEALQGKTTGDHVEVQVPPERGYGVYQDNKLQRVPVKHVLPPSKAKLKRGDVVGINTSEGQRRAIIIKVGKFNVDVDTNHPLAGKNLEFHIDIESVREATDEERAHRHAQGPGGHQHD